MRTYVFFRLYFATQPAQDTEEKVHEAILYWAWAERDKGTISEVAELSTALLDGYTLSRASGVYQAEVEGSWLLTLAVPSSEAATIGQQIPTFVRFLKEQFQQRAILVARAYTEQGYFL